MKHTLSVHEAYIIALHGGICGYRASLLTGAKRDADALSALP
jgi:hypothetical protein